MKNKTSKGLGDTIEKFTRFFGIDKFAKQTANMVGKEDCGCKRRQEKLNQLIPYNKKENQS